MQSSLVISRYKKTCILKKSIRTREENVDSTTLVLKQPERTLDNNVLEDGTRGNVDGGALGRNDDDGTLEGDATAKVDGTGNGQMVEFDDLGDGGDAGLEAGNLLEVAAKLDQGGGTESVGVDHQLTVLECVKIRLDEHEVRAGLDGQETLSGNVDTVCVLEVLDGSADSGLELENGDVGLALLVGRDGLAVGDDLHGKLVSLDNTLDGREVHPNVVGVEVLELLDRLELVDVLLGNLGDFKQTDGALVVDDSTTLDVSLGLVGQLHDVLRLGVNHVLEDAEIDNGTQVVGVGEEDVLDTAVHEFVDHASVVERLENITVARGVPVGNV